MSAGQAIGPYQIQEKLGAGGMGEVYKAQDTRVGRSVALKLLPESLAADTDRRRRFEQEARLAASLNHPNIMAIYDVGLDAHPPYIVAELVQGESLRATIERGPLPTRKAIDIAAQVAAGLAAAHTAGIVHRDLKPENLMTTPDGTVKILDFGVARMQTKTAAADQTATIGQTAAGAVVGTAAYMSPEQARASDVDYRSDQFSLALVLYEMLSGKQAFARPSAVQTMSSIVEDEPAPLERAIPAQLRWIVERCLAKDREARYESTRDLARELAQLRDHFSELTSATGTAQTPAVRTRRRVGVPVTAAGVVIAAVAAWCAARLLSDPRTVDVSKYSFTPFATALAEQFAPAWSPDGKSVAFLGRMPSGQLQLFVQAVDAPTAVDISGSDTEVYQGPAPFWSPDSRTVYYRCKTGPKWGLCRIPAGGGATTLVHEREIAGALSPDGQTLVTFSYPDGKVWTLHPPTSEPRLYDPQPVKIDSFYNTPSLAFTPDGKNIILGVALTGRGETSWLLPWPPGSSRQVFPQSKEFSNTPLWRWLPDSQHLIFADSTASGYSQTYLYMADRASNTYWPVLAQDRAAGSPSVSPDGSRVAYVSNLSHSDVIAVPLGDGPVRTLLASTRTYQMADVSPNGQQLVYATNRRGVGEIWISSLAEGWDRPLVSLSDIKVNGEAAQFLMTPVFSPDGRRVAVVVKFGSGTRIYTVFTSGGTPTAVTGDNHGFEVTPAWSPDGNWMVYDSLKGLPPKLMKVRPGSGEPPVDLGDYWGSALPKWSPSGDWIACYRASNSNLVLLSPDGKQVREISGDEGPVAWSRDGKKLYQVQDSPPALTEFDVASGQGRKLRDLPDLTPYASSHPGLMAALTGDGKSIVYTVNRPRQEIWILDGLQTPQPWYKRLLP